MGLCLLFQGMDFINLDILKIVWLIITLVIKGKGKNSRQKSYESKKIMVTSCMTDECQQCRLFTD